MRYRRSRYSNPPRASRSREPVGPSMLDVVKCPRCGARLVARQGARGPYFHCDCRVAGTAIDTAPPPAG